VEDREAGDWRLTCYYGYPERACHLWCIIGDFNDLLSQQDKYCIQPHPHWLCIGFCEVVDCCALSDIKLHSHPFTWIKSPGTNRVLEVRLDMAMGEASSYSFDDVSRF
jgi:hypothetical protein